MPARVSSWLLRPLTLRTLVLQVRLVARLMREPRVPVLLKTIPVLAGFYLIWPVDLVPDVFPALGQLDDLGVIVAALAVFRRLCPAPADAFHREAILQGRPYSPMAADGDVIDAEWRRE